MYLVFTIAFAICIIGSTTDIMTYLSAETDCPAKSRVTAFLSCSYAAAMI